jgi:transposase
MRGEILGVERRRFWHDDDKLEIVMSVGVGGASVTQVAQRHEIRRQQIYAWRHDLKKKGLWSPDAGALYLSSGYSDHGWGSGSASPCHPNAATDRS